MVEKAFCINAVFHYFYCDLYCTLPISGSIQETELAQVISHDKKVSALLFSLSDEEWLVFSAHRTTLETESLLIR